MPYWAMDYDRPGLFDLFMRAHVDAIVDFVNTHILEQVTPIYRRDYRLGIRSKLF